MPALLTAMCRPPWVVTAWSTAAWAWSGSVSSAATKLPVPPADSTSASTRRPFSSSRSTMTTVAPRDENLWMAASPIPDPPPVTSATRPCMFLTVVLDSIGLLLGSWGDRLQREDRAGAHARRSVDVGETDLRVAGDLAVAGLAAQLGDDLA